MEVSLKGKASFQTTKENNNEMTCVSSLNAGGFKYCGEYPWSGYKETDRGVGVELAFPTVLGGHSVRWEGVWRDLGCLSNSTSFAVREQAGHSLKSSLKVRKLFADGEEKNCCCRTSWFSP